MYRCKYLKLPICLFYFHLWLILIAIIFCKCVFVNECDFCEGCRDDRRRRAACHGNNLASRYVRTLFAMDLSSLGIHTTNALHYAFSCSLIVGVACSHDFGLRE